MADERERWDEVDGMLAAYLEVFAGEEERQAATGEFLARFRGRDRIDRANVVGHLTASAFIVDTRWMALLLVRHPYLERWLQPGGHLEVEDTGLLAAAFREVEEEVGLKRSEVEVVWPYGREVAVDMDAHGIPANPRKGEGAHVHHDVRFLMVCAEGGEARAREAGEVRWFPLKEAARDLGFAPLVEKLRKVREFLGIPDRE